MLNNRCINFEKFLYFKIFSTICVVFIFWYYLHNSLRYSKPISLSTSGKTNLYLNLEDNICQGLLTYGTFNLSENKWVPKSCKMKYYGNVELNTCISISTLMQGRTYISFIGDSRTKLMAGKLSRKFSNHVGLNGHIDGRFIQENSSIVVDSLWRPYVNDRMIKTIDDYSKLKPKYQPNILIIGAAIHIISQNKNNSKLVEEYGKNVSKLRNHLEKLSNTHVLWMLNQNIDQSKASAKFSSVTNKIIRSVNTAAIKALLGSNVHIWYSSRLLSLLKPFDYYDFVHRGDDYYEIDAQIVLNIVCNQLLFNYKGYCCTSKRDKFLFDLDFHRYKDV